MAINITSSELSAQFNAFARLAEDKALGQNALVRIDANEKGMGLLGPDGKPRNIVVKHGDTIGPWFGRSQENKDLNNKVRDLFLKTILDVCGVASIDKLPKAVRDVMKAGDYDGKGHPLSMRRIRAVTRAVIEEAGKTARNEEPVSGAKIKASIDIVEAAAAKIKVPVDLEEGSEVDDDGSYVSDEEEAVEYDTPKYIDGLPDDTEAKFMEFYDGAVSRSVAEGQTKEECDEAFEAMFNAIGRDEADREFLAELLADGKPSFLEKSGEVPFKDDAVKFARKVKGVLDAAKTYRAKLPAPYGDAVADAILAALKAEKKVFSADDLPKFDTEDCARIAKAAEKIDTAGLFAPPEGRGNVKPFNRKLEDFQQRASGVFASDVLSPNDSPLAATVKQNLVTILALAKAGAKPDSLVAQLDKHRNALVQNYGKQDLLNVISPCLKRMAR